MQAPKALSLYRWSRWPALAFAIIVSAVSPHVHAADAELAPQGAGITLQVLMSVDPVDPPGGYDFCGAVVTIVAYTGENVRWCYRITNNSDVPLTRHTLQSSEFGTILSNFPFTLVPDASAFITMMEPAGDSRQETATWHAYTPDTPDDFSDVAIGTLTVRPGIEVEVTASVDPLAPPSGYDACGTQSVIEVDPGRTVRWCYTVRNVSSIPRSRHSLVTTQHGPLLNDFPFTLVPGASAFLTATQVMGGSPIHEAATWTAFRPGPSYLSTATAMGYALEVGDAIFIWGFDQAP
jgi:hypothetical protein